MTFSGGLVRPSTLYYGDCLKVMEHWLPGQVDLIYLDPPFNSKTDYNILFGTDTNGKSAQLLAFQDTWHWSDEAAQSVENLSDAVGHPASKAIRGLAEILGPSGMLAYLAYMAQRLAPCARVLRSTGSIFLHCDPTASHYLKVLMDSIFGASQFRNEIVWFRKQGEKHNLATRRMPSAHDIILYYGRASTTFNIQYTPYSDEYVKKTYRFTDDKGRYATFPCTNDAGGNRPYEFKGITRAWRFKKERMQRMYEEGMLVAGPNNIFR